MSVKTELGTLPEKMLDVASETLMQNAHLMVTYARGIVRVRTGSLQLSIRVERGGIGQHWRAVRVRAGGYVTNPETGRIVGYARFVEALYPFMLPAWIMVRDSVTQQIKDRVAKTASETVSNSSLLAGLGIFLGGGSIKVSGGQTEIEYLLTVNAEMAYTDLRRLESSLMRIMGYISQLSGDPNIDKMMQKAQETISLVRQLQIAYRTMLALEAGTLGGPIGWLYAGTMLAGIGLSVAEEVRMSMP